MGLVFSMARMFSWIIMVIVPVLLILISLLCAYIPGAPEVLMDFFVNLFGEVEIFGNAVEMLSILYDSEQIIVDNVGLYFLGLLVNSLSETLVIACCIFAVKVTFLTLRPARANTPGGIDQIIRSFRAPVFLLTALGVALGVLVCRVGDRLLPTARALFVSLLPVALMLYGIVIMVGAANSYQRARRRANVYAVLVELLGEILGGAAMTLCMVLCVVCLFAGPKLVKEGMPAWILLVLYLSAAAAIWLTYQLTEWMRPRRYTNTTPFS